MTISGLSVFLDYDPGFFDEEVGRRWGLGLLLAERRRRKA